MRKMTLKQLQLFVYIAKLGTIQKAAQQIFLSQPAASMALSELENHLNVKLFNRRGKKLILNDIGKRILPKAIAVIDSMNVLSDEIKNDATALRGTLNIGASSTIGHFVLPKILSQFRLDQPSITINLHVNNSNEIIDEVAHFNVDIGLIESYCTHPELEVSAWIKDQLMIFCAPDHPLTKKTSITLSDLQQAKWILREHGSGTREVFEKIIFDAIHQLNVIGEMNSSFAIKQYILNSEALSCLSRHVIQEEINMQACKILNTPLPTINRYFYLIKNKEKFSSPALETFIQWLYHQEKLGYIEAK